MQTSSCSSAESLSWEEVKENLPPDERWIRPREDVFSPREENICFHKKFLVLVQDKVKLGRDGKDERQCGSSGTGGRHQVDTFVDF